MRNLEDTPALPIDRGALEQALRGDVRAVKAFREALKTANERLGERFRRNESIETLVADRARVVDEVILASWLHFAANVLESVDLVAVGGYGRSELAPGSDLDVLVVHRGRHDVDELAQRVWYPIWEEGIALDHGVKTLAGALEVGARDLKAALGLLDARTVWRAVLCGALIGLATLTRSELALLAVLLPVVMWRWTPRTGRAGPT